jgi:hypothetical protein
MHTTVDRPKGSERTMERLAELAEDAAFLLMLFSGIVIVIAIIALEFAA